MTDESTQTTALTEGTAAEAQTDEQATNQAPEAIIDDKTKKAEEQVVEEEKEVKESGEESSDKGDDEKSEDSEDKADDKDESGAPEEYESFQVPEGMELDSALLEEATPLFKELNLTQEQAQKLVDFQTAQNVKAAEAEAAAYQETVEGWANEAQNDPVIGGQNFDTTIKHAKMALDAFGSKELNGLLNSSGYGNHKDVISVFAAVGKHMAEHNLIIGPSGGLVQQPKPAHEILFPSEGDK